ncbi:MAG: hypothetical protein WCH77_12975 [Planctomycetota bacterium]
MSHYVVVYGLEKIGEDGKVETSAWVIGAPGQADYVTDGLLATATDLRDGTGPDDDD